MISHATSRSTSGLEQLNAIQVESVSAFTGLFLAIAAQIVSVLPFLVQNNKTLLLSLQEKSKKQLHHNDGFGGLGESWVHPQNFKLVCQISKGRKKRVNAGFK